MKRILHLPILALISLLILPDFGFSQVESVDDGKDVYEIELNKLDNGTRVGGITWVTNGGDEQQKFVIRNLDIYDPVQVILFNPSVADPLTLNFHKGDWKNAESSIVSKGKEIGKKIFRTYNSAAMSLQSSVKGIPYMIMVQVGKPLPARNTPFIRFTDNREEAAAYKSAFLPPDNQSQNSALGAANDIPANSPSEQNGISGLLYIIIALLGILILILILFLFRKKKALLLLIGLFFSGTCYVSAQSGVPRQVPTDGITDFFVTVDQFRNARIFLVNMIQDHLSYVNDNFDDIYPELRDIKLRQAEDRSEFYDVIGAHSDELSELFDAITQIRQELNNFRQEFNDNMPGEVNESGQNHLSPEVSREEMEALRIEVQALRAQVEYLSNRDRSYDVDPGGQSIVIYCNDIPACGACIGRAANHLFETQEKIRKLNRILLHSEWVSETGLSMGNALANSTPGASMGWKEQVINVNQARRKLWESYNRKFDELIGRMTPFYEKAIDCSKQYNAEADIPWIQNTLLNTVNQLMEERVPTPSI